MTGTNVLLVEDNTINQKVALKMLASFGCNAKVAENGQVCLRILEQEKFDIVLMDCHMPVMDGFEATMRIRQLEQTRCLSRTPIVALTAAATREQREKCLACGMDDWLAKPFERADLVKVLHKYISPPSGPSCAAQPRETAVQTFL